MRCILQRGSNLSYDQDEQITLSMQRPLEMDLSLLILSIAKTLWYANFSLAMHTVH